MKNYYIKATFYLFFPLLIFANLRGSGQSPPFRGGKTLPIKLQAQQNLRWCWAASLSMVINYLCPTISIVEQCDLASQKIVYHKQLQFGPNPKQWANCCDTKKKKCEYLYQDSSPCNTSLAAHDTTWKWKLAIDEINFLLRPYKLEAKKLSSSTGNVLIKIKKAISAKNPVLGLYSTDGGSNTHLVVIIGYSENKDGQTILLINNPLDQPDLINCKGCFHAILTNNDGSNALSWTQATYTGNEFFLTISKQ